MLGSNFDCTERGTIVAPLLVVEVLSRSTRRRDLTQKWSICAEAGVPSYWLVDPGEPSLTVTEPFPRSLRLRR